jgi:putative endonuclease
MPGNLHKGLCYETEAARYLEGKGCRLLTRGFRCRFGEIDLIVEDGDTVCFVEVKFRGTLGFGGAAFAIPAAKQRKLIKTAQYCILSNPGLANQAMRFDALLIQRQADGGDRYDWIKNAFYAE